MSSTRKPIEYKKNEQIGDWKLERPLGEGGQGQVWKVRHLREHHSPPSALKVCTTSDAKGRARFSREVKILHEHRHQGIVAIRDQGAHGGVPFFVMELATTSMDRLATADSAGIRVLRDSPTLLISFFRQACAAVAHLHGKGVLHRDLKPSNVLLFLDPPEPMRTAVADLGIAVPAAEQGLLTGTQEVIGTPVFRAPETFNGSHQPSSDVYSLGKILEFIFTRAIPSEMGPGRCLRGPGLSDDLWDKLDEILQNACAYEPKARYEDAGALLNALPEVVLVKADVRLPKSAIAGNVSLGWRELQLLAALIAACPTDSAVVSYWNLSQRAGLGDFAFSMAFRELRRMGFIDVDQEEDRDGNTWEAFRPSGSAFEWARSHPEEMEPPGHDDQAPEDDEVPF
ncbi:MAG: serine/threonine protein kinase [Rhodospirillales bacterium]|nr:serine/threonine protein kinase [Rhodospirillales bacterium]